MQIVYSVASEPSTSFVAVDARVLVKRINRKLAADGNRILRAHPADRHTVGEYFMVDENNITVECWIDLENTGRELGVLKSFEAASAA